MYYGVAQTSYELAHPACRFRLTGVRQSERLDGFRCGSTRTPRHRRVLDGASRPRFAHRLPDMPESGHPGVDAYIAALPDWQREICAELRQLIRIADSEIEETIKRSVQPYFVLEGNVC